MLEGQGVDCIGIGRWPVQAWYDGTHALLSLPSTQDSNTSIVGGGSQLRREIVEGLQPNCTVSDAMGDSLDGKGWPSDMQVSQIKMARKRSWSEASGEREFSKTCHCKES